MIILFRGSCERRLERPQCVPRTVFFRFYPNHVSATIPDFLVAVRGTRPYQAHGIANSTIKFPLRTVTDFISLPTMRFDSPICPRV